ncbi:antibiotic biosynthesis monooxygenase [Frankia sp. CNm7]|uniref:Antibiotic biosynthesis monooxygenase n=1 Tax=Frankia nepalensis TaxID=1836974 RepID=A0A937UJC3_9ACTN|nr:antibiotic biosynthesis monooxygenase [Frankia nepalensis]MBL7498588.1 antibiotic biosynthesis monooxygenase [Frankia nepalensis]MBL7510457.1 antibiotic biosynthesis monooxygenase [Frankia nepalensis]MBL7517203.1 antibiotic biosynthesis monooxygenase [Frankia nepalensis]MBL7625649.1 antibiotic biosynthesis monooxygenase [Frankia nepalensis]
MATIPWSTPPAVADASAPSAQAPAGPPVVMASRFALTSRRRHTVAMLRHALRVRRALLATRGALGVSLVAHPLRGEYWTLSAWSDRGSLDTFVRAPEHLAAMRALAPAMADSTFVFWAHDAGAEPPTWADARARVAAERSARQPAAPPSTT